MSDRVRHHVIGADTEVMSCQANQLHVAAPMTTDGAEDLLGIQADQVAHALDHVCS